MQGLNSAESGYCYRIADIKDGSLANRLATYGLFKNSVITKIDPDDVQYATLKVNSKNGTAAIPGQLSKTILVRSGRGQAKSIYDIAEGKSANVAAIDGCEKTKARLSVLGIEEGVRLKVLKRLPHMEYVVLVDQKKRLRVSEAIASVIVGETLNQHKQFSFARKGKDFKVKTIQAGKKIQSYLSNVGIEEGVTICLEGIEPGKNIVFDENGTLSVYAMDGFRLIMTEENAEKIMVG